MEFFLTLGIIAAIAALLSAGFCVPIFRLKKRYAKPIALVVGLILFVVLSLAGVFLLILESTRRGHPF